MTASVPSGLLSLISAAVTPVVLITAAAILLSGFTAKYGNMADQMRRLTAEYRSGETSEARRATVVRELALFARRIEAIWAATTCLCIAILAFLMMVLAVIFALKATRLGELGVATLVIGLAFMVLAVVCELEELRLARKTASCELRETLKETRRD